MSTHSKHAGPRQHHLPQFLLRGFAFRSQGTNHYVYLYRTKASVHEVNTINVGLASYFYGRPQEASVDAQLQARENQYAQLVKDLRQGGAADASKHSIDEFVSHLLVRTKNLRDVFCNASNMMFDELERALAQPENQSHLRQHALDQLPEVLADRKYKALLSRLSPEQQEALLSEFEAFIRASDVSSAVVALFRSVRGGLDIPQMARRGHIAALEDLDSVLRKRAKFLAPLSWSIVEYPRGTFVLGDVAAVSRHEDSSALDMPIKFKGTPQSLFLPLSSQHLLVGQRQGLTPKVDADEVNLASVELSLDFFVASQATDRERAYSQRLAARAILLNTEEMREITARALAES